MRKESIEQPDDRQRIPFEFDAKTGEKILLSLFLKICQRNIRFHCRPNTKSYAKRNLRLFKNDIMHIISFIFLYSI